MSARFTKENLFRDGCDVFFLHEGKKRFVARFKRAAGIGSFMTHLRKHWTPDSYFEAYEAGLAPLEIVEKTGYLLPHLKRWLKNAGFEPTPEGLRLYSMMSR